MFDGSFKHIKLSLDLNISIFKTISITAPLWGYPVSMTGQSPFLLCQPQLLGSQSGMCTLFQTEDTHVTNMSEKVYLLAIIGR